MGRGREDRRTSRCTALLAERYNGGKVATACILLRRRRLVHARATPHRRSARRDAPPSRRRLHHAQDEGRRPAARRRRAPRRGGEEHAAVGHAARGRRQLQIRPRRGARLRQRARAVRAALVRGAVRPAGLRARSPRSRAPSAAARHRREPVLHARTWTTSCASAACAPTRDVIQIDPPQAYGIVPVRPHARHAGAPRLAAQRAVSRMAATRCRSPSRRASASAARNPIPACSAPSAASPTTRGSRTAISTLSDRPGIGFEGQAALYGIMRELAA